jgi:hypothetical protein
MRATVNLLERDTTMDDVVKELVDVHAVAYNNNGDYQIRLVDAPPVDNAAYAKVLEPTGDGRQLVLWVPEGTPGALAQNMATHFVPQLRKISPA